MIQTFPTCIPTLELALKKRLFLSLHNQWQAAYLTSCPGKEKIEKKKKSNFGDVEIKGTTSVAGARPLQPSYLMCSGATCTRPASLNANAALWRARWREKVWHPLTLAHVVPFWHQLVVGADVQHVHQHLRDCGRETQREREAECGLTKRRRLKNGRRLKSRLPNASKQTFSPYRGASDYCL